MSHVLDASRRAPFFSPCVVALSLAAALAGACGGDEAAPEGPGPIPVQSLRAEHEAASCELAVRCGLMPDKATCQRVDGADRELLQLLADVVYGAVSYDPAAARACVDAIRGRSCDVLLSAQNEIDAACRAVFKGSSPEGGPCVVAGECAGDSVCDTSMCGGGACCIGECAPAPGKVPLGGDCSESACVDAAWCDDGEGDPAPTCEARIENGQACAASHACKDGQRCDRNGEGGKCYILSKDGQACNPNLEIACLASNQWCDPASSKCVSLPGAGEPCAADRCLGYAYCDAGTCRARPVEGGACAQGGSPRCLGALRCEDDLCTTPQSVVVCVPDDQP